MKMEDCITMTGENVVDEGKWRIRKLMERTDTLVVSFSGGKDSMVMAELAREVFDEDGRQDEPVKLFFLDEEVIPPDVLDTVNTYRTNPRFELTWLACKMKTQYSFMGGSYEYFRWDENRETGFMRPKPKWAIGEVPGLDGPITQNEMSEKIIPVLYEGQGIIGQLLGLRSQESRTRRQAALRTWGRLGYMSPQAGGTIIGRPIYDWLIKDVFRYLLEREAPLTDAYRNQMFAGAQLRVSTPLHDAAVDTLLRYQAMYPDFYERMCEVFPWVPAQVRYIKQFDRNRILSQYEPTFAGMRQYIEDNYDDPDKRKLNIGYLRQVAKLRSNNLRKGRLGPTGGVPLLAVWDRVLRASLHRGFTPIREEEVSKKMLEYEATGRLSTQEEVDYE